MLTLKPVRAGTLKCPRHPRMNYHDDVEIACHTCELIGKALDAYAAYMAAKRIAELDISRQGISKAGV